MVAISLCAFAASAVWLAGTGAPRAAGPSRPQLSADEVELRVATAERQPEMERTLERWVAINTGSFNLAGLRSLATELGAALEAVGLEVEIRPGSTLSLPGRGDVETGPLVIARKAATVGVETAPRLLLVGHYDTVFEPSSPFQSFARDPADPTVARGPGVADMKGGLVVMIEALRALRASGELERAHWTVLLDPDEEIGSLGSRETLEGLARAADVGLVFESAQEGGAMVRSRRGLGQFHLSVEGVPAHAGSAHDRGRSAILALARKIVEIEALTDYSQGVTLNVGTITGGTKRNIVPGRAEAWIDVRYDAPELGDRIRSDLERIAAEAHVDGTRATLWGRLHRPPKAATAAVDGLLDTHRAIVAAMGLDEPTPVHSGGGTDGSLMGAVGLPTLDSMGAVGGRAHTADEFIELPSLSQRAAIAAILMRRLIAAQLYAPPGAE